MLILKKNSSWNAPLHKFLIKAALKHSVSRCHPFVIQELKMKFSQFLVDLKILKSIMDIIILKFI
jgi:hypothetical protein